MNEVVFTISLIAGLGAVIGIASIFVGIALGKISV